MASHAFCALVAAGGTGEMYSMTADEIEQVVEVSVQAVNGRMPVVAGTGFNAAMGADIARRAANAGAQAILALPPYYVMPPEDGLFAYYAAIGKATDLPLFVYSRDWAVFTPQMVARLSGSCANPGWLERWAGRHPPLSAHHAIERRSSSLVRRVGRRLRARILCDRGAGIYFQHFDDCAEALAANGRSRNQAGLR